MLSHLTRLLETMSTTTSTPTSPSTPTSTTASRTEPALEIVDLMDTWADVRYAGSHILGVPRRRRTSSSTTTVRPQHQNPNPDAILFPTLFSTLGGRQVVGVNGLPLTEGEASWTPLGSPFLLPEAGRVVAEMDLVDVFGAADVGALGGEEAIDVEDFIRRLGDAQRRGEEDTTIAAVAALPGALLALADIPSPDTYDRLVGYVTEGESSPAGSGDGNGGEETEEGRTAAAAVEGMGDEEEDSEASPPSGVDAPVEGSGEVPRRGRSQVKPLPPYPYECSRCQVRNWKLSQIHKHIQGRGDHDMKVDTCLWVGPGEPPATYARYGGGKPVWGIETYRVKGQGTRK